MPPSRHDDAPQSLDDLVIRRAALLGQRPFLTFYDDDRDERLELSWKALENWAAKTANLLAEELGAAPGDRVASLLGHHWQALVLAFACWRLGACLAPVPEAAPAGRLAALLGAAAPAAAFARRPRLADAGAALPAPGVLVAVPAQALGGAREDFGGVPNYARLVPSMADLFDPPPGAGLAAAALLPAAPAPGLWQAPLTGRELLGRARAAAGRLGLGEGDRLACLEPADTPEGLVDGALAAWWAGAALLLVRGLAPGGFWARAAQERVTVLAAPAGVLAALAAVPGEVRLRAIACSGGELPPDAAAALAARLGAPLLPTG